MSSHPNADDAGAILFDIDGTLISTGGAGAKSWRWAFEQLYGVPADIGKSSETGMTDPEVAERTYVAALGREPTGRELARLMGSYLDRLPTEVENSEGYKVLQGVEELLPRLSRHGYLLGITTGALEAAAHIKLSRARLNRFFCFGGYGSDSRDRVSLTKRALERAALIVNHPIDPRRAMLVGDTPRDIQAAQGAGTVSVGVASGHYSKQDLRAAHADYVLASLREPLPLEALAG